MMATVIPTWRAHYATMPASTQRLAMGFVTATATTSLVTGTAATAAEFPPLCSLCNGTYRGEFCHMDFIGDDDMTATFTATRMNVNVNMIAVTGTFAASTTKPRSQMTHAPATFSRSVLTIPIPGTAAATGMTPRPYLQTFNALIDDWFEEEYVRAYYYYTSNLILYFSSLMAAD
ncbi:hypothetical protein Pelo_6114 [Pelomyxa schiedti]|nr:hypothetical protein Pelo_6114 [Pelomyxa schiedti]